MRTPELITDATGLPRWRNLPAPAKLNLFLHVVGRRADGMHELQSIFTLIDWADYLDITVRSDGLIERIDGAGQQPIELPADDLCVRAANCLKEHTGVTLGATIRLEKNLPAEAGMGGGSSDAATCLLALNHLWGCKLSVDTLCELGATLGADVPFFIRGHDAWVEGIGEIIRPVDLPELSFWVVKPAAGVSTPAIFKAPHLNRQTKRVDLTTFNQRPLTDRANFGHNDLQPVATELCPDIQAALDRLAALGLQGRMTGSGSTVFAIAPDGGTEILRDLPDGWLSRKCKKVGIHPLANWESSKNVG